MDTVCVRESLENCVWLGCKEITLLQCSNKDKLVSEVTVGSVDVGGWLTGCSDV